MDFGMRSYGYKETYNVEVNYKSLWSQLTYKINSRLKSLGKVILKRTMKPHTIFLKLLNKRSKIRNNLTKKITMILIIYFSKMILDLD